jgi:tetratricopeptide (TPR) repeat protein
MVDLPQDLVVTNNTRPDIKLADTVNINWSEFSSFLRFYNDDIIPKNSNQLKQLLQTDKSDDQAVLWSAVGRSVFRSGHFINAKKIFDYSMSILSNKNDPAQSYVLLEYCNYLRFIFQHDQVLNILNQMSFPVENEKMINWQLYTHNAIFLTKGDLSQIPSLLELADYFKNIEHYFLQSHIHYIIGNQLRREKQFEKVMPYYKEAEVIAKKHNIPQMLSDIYHCMGLYEYHRGNPKDSWKNYERGLKHAVGFYQDGFLHVNIGWTHFQLGNFPQAESHYKQALDTFTEHGIFQQIPGACYYLGAICEAEEKLLEAREYYQLGFKTSTFLVENGFPLAGDRKKAVDGYVQFLEKHPDTVSFLPRPDFSFAIDKTMKQIRATFQLAFLNTLFDKFKTVEAVVNQIQISRPGYFQIKRRNKDFAILPYPKSVLEFASKNLDDTWKVFNKKFEAETLAFLYSSYGHNKRVMSQKLEMNYEHLVALTAGIKRGMTVVEA